jgi:predicted transcriptional regulator
VVKTLLMSIKPAYSDQILAGTKKFELRRTPVKVVRGDRVVVYASAPVMAVVGTFEVREVVRRSPREVWADHQDELGIAEGPYFDYFEGAGTAHAIAIGRVKRIAPVSLAALRERVPGFRPPQSYMMWTGDVDILTNPGVVSAAAAK